MDNRLKASRTDDLFCFFVFLYPLLRYYKLPIIGMGFEAVMALLLGIIAFFLWLSRFSLEYDVELRKTKNYFLLFLLWSLLITAFFEMFTEYNLNNPMANYNINSMIIFFMSGFVIFFIVRGIVFTDRCLKIYTAFVYVLLAIVILQWILLFMGIRISFKMPFEYTSDWSYMNKKIFGMNAYPTGLFSERSHLCEYICPYIALCLFSQNLGINNRMRKAIVFSILILSTASGNGIIILLIEWSLWLLGFGQEKTAKKSTKRILIIIIGAAVLVLLYFYLSHIPRFEEMFSKLFFDSSGSQFTASKADYRIYRGFDIYSKIPFLEKILGVGYKHMYLFSQNHEISSAFDYSWHDVYEYFSAISMVLLYFGIVGFYLFYSHLLELYKSRIDVVRGIIIIMVALFFSCEMLLNYSHIMFMVLIIAAFNIEKKCVSEGKET